MKKMMFMSMIIACNWFSADAQVSFSLNIGSQPAWGPTGYDHADYYYLPDANAYYDINRKVFVYQEGRSWKTAGSLPGRYGNVDLYHVHKVVINNDRDPWKHNERDHKQYGSFAGRRDQQAIRESHDQKYFQNPGHPEYNKWRQQHGNDNNGRGRDDHNDRGHGDDHGRGH